MYALFYRNSFCKLGKCFMNIYLHLFLLVAKLLKFRNDYIIKFENMIILCAQ